MKVITIEELYSRYPNITLIAECERCHPLSGNLLPIEVYCLDIIFSKSTSFWLFYKGKHVSNFISFACNVLGEDKKEIAKDMMDELLECSVLRHKDDEVEYHIPEHINYWKKTEGKWGKVYGFRTKNHKEYVKNKMINTMNNFMHTCGDDKSAIKEILKYGKSHFMNKYPRLFK